MEKTYIEDNDEIEIDLRELLFEFKKKIWLILGALLIGTVAAGAGSKFLITPQYQSEAKLYILSKETTLTSLADLQIGSQLTQDYKVLVSSRPVMEGVISHLNLDLTYKELVKKLTVDNPKDTRILSLTVKDADPNMAKAIVDDIANTSSDFIGEIMEMIPPKLIEDGVVAAAPFSPNIMKNAVVGGLLIMLFVCGVIAMRVVLNDTVKTEDDVEKYLNLPVLAVIPKKTGRSVPAEPSVHGASHKASAAAGVRKDARTAKGAGTPKDAKTPKDAGTAKDAAAQKEESVDEINC